MRAVIAGYSRSPFQPAHKGGLAGTRPEDFASQVARETLLKTGVSGDDVEDLMLGCAYPEGEQGLNLGRILTYMAGLPTTVPGMTTNRLCGSSMQVIHSAAGAISMGSGDCFLCGGVESMSRVQRGGFNHSPHPALESRFPEAYIAMGLTAENLAKSHDIGRVRQEQFALLSHQKAARAQSEGQFSDELVAITTAEGEVDSDGCVRASTTLEAMARLKPAFDAEGSVTAATSSPLTDGAAFLIVCSEDFAAANGITPLASIVSSAVAGVGPEVMGIGPVPAAAKALSRAGISLADLSVIELNEAFAAQSIAVLSDLGLDDDDPRVNIDGGALAIGHPLGASGARITGKAASLLNRVEGQYGLATMCIGGGMGIATILEAWKPRT
jgi:acetyl-CoA acyltransferase